MRKKTIIFSNYDDLKNPYYGGGGSYAIHKVCERLVNIYDVLVLTGSYPGAKNRIIDGVQYKRIGFSVGHPKIDQIIYQVCLYYYALTEKYDLWFESLTPPFSSSFLPLLIRKPVIGVAHMLSGKDMKRKYHLPFDLIQNLGLKLYRSFIVLSENSKKEIEKINNKACIKIIPNGVDLPEKIGDKKENKILFIGRIEINQKGIDLLLCAWRKVCMKKDIKLIIAGSGDKFNIHRLKRLINKYDLRDSVECIGKVEGKAKDKLFRKCLFLVSPSRYETFPVVALEAFSYSLPLLCFDINGYRWIPKSSCLKTKSFDVDKFANNIEKMIVNKCLRKDLSHRSREFVKKYNWDAVASMYQVYIDEKLVLGSFDDNRIVKSIISNKKRCVFISPHFDDAALSAGGLIVRLSDKCKVTVINVFTKGSKGPYTLSADKFLRLSGEKDAEQLFAKREVEDNNAFNKKNINIINLGYIDASFRTKQVNYFVDMLSKLIPEISHVYPFYRRGVLDGKISQYDNQLIRQIKTDLLSIVQNNDIVFSPLAVGGHVDHKIVNSVIGSFKNKKYCWVDYPYSGYNSFQNHSRSGMFVFRGKQNEKISMIKQYKSQLNGIFPKGIENIPSEIYLF